MPCLHGLALQQLLKLQLLILTVFCRQRVWRAAKKWVDGGIHHHHAYPPDHRLCPL